MELSKGERVVVGDRPVGDRQTSGGVHGSGCESHGGRGVDTGVEEGRFRLAGKRVERSEETDRGMERRDTECEGRCGVTGS